MIRFSGCLLVLILSIQSARADGLFYRLPLDGAWVKYEVKTVADLKYELPEGVTLNEPLPNKHEDLRILTVSSVGQEIVQGEKCRWIEVKTELVKESNSGSYPLILVKMLIPEKHLVQGDDPIAHVLSLYIKRSQDARLITDEKKKQYEIDRLRHFYPAPLLDVQDLEEKTFETKTGPIRCRGIAGRSEYKGSLVEPGSEYEWTATFEHYLDEQVPFGLAASVIRMRGHEQSAPGNLKGLFEATITVSVLEWGENATSVVPGTQP